MLREIDQYFENKEEPVRSCLLAIRDTILTVSDEISLSWKWRMPVFLYRKKMLCYLRTDKVSGFPNLGIVKGNEMDHALLIKGPRKKMKILAVSPEEDIPVEEIRAIISEALLLY